MGPFLVGRIELGDILAISQRKATRLVRESGFPPAAARTPGGDVWDLRQVQQWLDEPAG